MAGSGDRAGDILLLGVDGGGSGCRARLADGAGTVLGEGRGGPANIATDLDGAAGSILGAARQALAAAGLGEADLARTRAGIGVAGGNVSGPRAALAALGLPFAAIRVASDAEIACLGAHGGGEGAILILGTGSQGLAMTAAGTRTVGGWGFLLSDGGSGAVLGHAAARRAVAGAEEIEPATPFTAAVIAALGGTPEAALAFARRAIPKDWADLAPLVFRHAAEGDPAAVALLSRAVADVVTLVDRLVALGAKRVSLMGGLAAAYRPHLPGRLDEVLADPAGDALEGAIALARR